MVQDRSTHSRATKHHCLERRALCADVRAPMTPNAWGAMQLYPPTEAEVAALQKGEDVISLGRATAQPQAPGKSRRKGGPGAAQFTAAQIEVSLTAGQICRRQNVCITIKCTTVHTPTDAMGTYSTTASSLQPCLMPSLYQADMIAGCVQERLASHAEAQSRPEVRAIAAARAALPIAPYRCANARHHISCHQCGWHSQSVGCMPKWKRCTGPENCLDTHQSLAAFLVQGPFCAL